MKLETWEQEIATSIVESLVEYGLLGHLFRFGDKSISNWFDEMGLGGCGFYISGGITKVCISHKDLDNWIIKVGYRKGVSIDYAELEYKNYLAAVISKLEYYFPTTVFLGEFDGVKFFLQERAICDEEVVTFDWYDKICNQFEELDEEYDDEIIWGTIDDLNDEERVELTFGDLNLVNFLSSHFINDLHEGNFGVIGDHIVIIDFSGWLG